MTPVFAVATPTSQLPAGCPEAVESAHGTKYIVDGRLEGPMGEGSKRLDRRSWARCTTIGYCPSAPEIG